MGIAEMLDELKQKALRSEAESRASGNEESITAICGILQQMQGTWI